MTKKKRIHVYFISGNYGYGWERLYYVDTYKEAKDDLKSYRENERSFSFRIEGGYIYA